MLGTCLGCPWVSLDSGMGRTVGLEPSRVGHSGHVRDVPGLPGTPGWDRQSHHVRDILGISGTLG